MFKKTTIRGESIEDFMVTARTRYAAALAADAEDRAAAEDDVDFAAGNQWRPEARERRVKFKQPILTWNRLPTFIAQVSNTGRENKPAIQTTPMDGGTKETAEFYQGRIRHIEYETDSDIAYDTARRQQIVSGRAFIRIATEYKPGKSMAQTVRIEPIENQFSVLFEPTARKYDRSDADYCFVFSWVSKDAYERKYGKDTIACARHYFAQEANPAPDWINVGPSSEMIQVAEYWLKHHEMRKLVMLPDLSTAWEDELPDDFNRDHIVGDCEKDEVTVTQYIIDGVEPLAETEFLVPFIPIAPLWGESMIVKGKRENYSLVRWVKDPQRLVNLYVSNIAGEIARMPKTPYIVAEGQIEGREDEWENINDDPRAVVQYKAKDVNGTLVGKPSREVNEPPIQALTVGLNQAIDAMKAGMGIFDAALGAQANEVSGTAIERRKQQSTLTNYHFGDNEARTRKYIGRILLALIPHLDKGAREVPTRTEDGKTNLVKVGQPYKDPKTGQIIQHDLGSGDYDIAVSSGPTNTSQRAEAFQAYRDIAANDKNFMQIAGDLLFRNSDMPGSDQIADRYEKMLPPALKPPDPNGAQAAQQSQQAIQALTAQHGQLVEQVHKLSTALETKQAEQQAKVEIARMQEDTKMSVAELDRATKIAIAEIGARSQDATRASADALAALEIRNAMMDRAHEHGMAVVAHGHAADLAAAGQQHAKDMQTGAQDHATGLAEAGQEHAADMQDSAQTAAADAAATPAPEPQPRA